MMEVIQQISDVTEWEQLARALVCISVPKGDCLGMIKDMWEQEINKAGTT